MCINFVPWFFRKYSPIHKLHFIKQRGFSATNLLHYIQSHKLKNSSLHFGRRTFSTITTEIWNLPRTYGHRFLYRNFTGLNYGGISKLHKSWNFYGIGTGRFQHGFYRSLVFSKRIHCWGQFSRNFSNSRNHYQQRNRTTAIYTVALVVVVLGASYAAVPLYRIFCQASGLGGTVQQADAGEKIKNMTTRKERLLTIRFNADKSATMQWSFKPQQSEVKVYPGETALAFYTAKNPTDVPITGISTYNVIPFEAGQYFNKIQ
ncbi:Cytochrome c oxidase assembly COX11, mitochondrial, partial [Paramuricea clavata]